jgi:hypothetical protein
VKIRPMFRWHNEFNYKLSGLLEKYEIDQASTDIVEDCLLQLAGITTEIKKKNFGTFDGSDYDLEQLMDDQLFVRFEEMGPEDADTFLSFLKSHNGKAFELPTQGRSNTFVIDNKFACKQLLPMLENEIDKIRLSDSERFQTYQEKSKDSDAVKTKALISEFERLMESSTSKFEKTQLGTALEVLIVAKNYFAKNQNSAQCDTVKLSAKVLLNAIDVAMNSLQWCQTRDDKKLKSGFQDYRNNINRFFSSIPTYQSDSEFTNTNDKVDETLQANVRMSP